MMLLLLFKRKRWNFAIMSLCLLQATHTTHQTNNRPTESRWPNAHPLASVEPHHHHHQHCHCHLLNDSKWQRQRQTNFFLLLPGALLVLVFGLFYISKLLQLHYTTLNCIMSFLFCSSLFIAVLYGKFCLAKQQQQQQLI